MTKQTLNNYALALALSATALGLLAMASIPSGLAQSRLVSKFQGRNPATAAARAASRQAKTPGTPSYTYTLLNFPGSLDTVASGINPGATTSKIEIVGSFGASAFTAHVSGTRTVTEAYQAVNLPHGATPIDINDLGQVVGSYVDSSGVNHGFELSDGKFTTIDVPFAGATGTIPGAISNSGEIVGTWGNGSDSNSTGFTLIDGTYTSFTYPGSVFTICGTVNNDGDIVGFYGDSNGTDHGFLLSGGTYTSFEVPGAAQTVAIANNDAGVIVGYYCTTSGCPMSQYQGFVLNAGVYTTIAIPGEPSTLLYDINNNGVLLGNYQDAAGLTYSFLATP